MFGPLLKELKGSLVPLGLAAMMTFYGFTAPSPPIFIAGIWALVVTVALAVFRSLREKGDDEKPREM